MDKHPEDLLLLHFDRQKKTLVLYQFTPDGEKYLYTTIGLDRMIQSGKEKACKDVGDIVLLGLDATREALF